MHTVSKIGQLTVILCAVLAASACGNKENEEAPSAASPVSPRPGSLEKNTSALVAVSAEAPENKQAKSYDAHAPFWQAFQSAVASKDAKLVSEFIEFPFRTRGPMDGDPVTTVNVEEFIALWPTLLSLDPGMTVDPTTMVDMVAATAEIPPIALDMQDGIAFRVGNFEFVKGDTGWHFAMSYISQ